LRCGTLAIRLFAILFVGRIPTKAKNFIKMKNIKQPLVYLFLSVYLFSCNQNGEKKVEFVEVENDTLEEVV